MIFMDNHPLPDDFHCYAVMQMRVPMGGLPPSVQSLASLDQVSIKQKVEMLEGISWLSVLVDFSHEKYVPGILSDIKIKTTNNVRYFLFTK